MSKKVVVNAEVIEQTKIGSDVMQLVFCAPEIAVQAMPGQFVHIRISDKYHPLLRRPISIADIDEQKGFVSIIYRIIGEGTKMLSTYKKGDRLDCMGPLGNGFTLRGERPLLIGGGMGIAPLIYLTRALCPRPTEVLLGGRSESEMFWVSLFEDVCEQVHVSTDDGSLGIRGTTVDALPTLLAEKKYDIIYTCGPNPMMREVVKVAGRYNIPCQISLEKYMACGVGACLSCTCGGSDGKRRKVCTDGPVFWAEEVTEW